MEITLQQFGGGLNNWMAPGQVPPTEGLQVRNCDLTEGTVKPLAGALAVVEPEGMSYRSATRSVVKWNNQYFWTDNDNGLMDSSLGYVGVLPPSAPPGITLQEQGNRFTGTYRYLATFVTKDGWESAPAAMAGDDVIPWSIINASRTVATQNPATLVAWSPYHVYGRHLYGYAVGSRVSYNAREYECLQSHAGAYPFLDGKDPATLGSSYWKDITSTTYTTAGYDSIKVALPFPSESSVATINLYRTIKDGSEFYLVAAIPAGTGYYTDSTMDTDLLLSTAYTIQYLYPPVYAYADGKFALQPVKYLAELNGTFYLASGDKVFLSEQSNPHAWNPLKFVSFNLTITGLARAGDSGILVFTKNQAYLLTGTVLQDITKVDLQVGQGCANWRTICYLRNMPLWMSYDGLCAYQPYEGREGKAVQLLLQGKVKWPEMPTHAAASADVYYGFLSDGTALRVDFKQGVRPDTIDADADYAYYDPENDRLVIAKDNMFYALLEGDELSWTYETPDLTTNDPAGLKFFRRVAIDADGTVTLGITLDNVFVKTLTSPGTGKRWVFLPRGMRGERIRFTLGGQTTLRCIKVELFGG